MGFHCGICLNNAFPGRMVSVWEQTSITLHHRWTGNRSRINVAHPDWWTHRRPVKFASNGEIICRECLCVCWGCNLFFSLNWLGVPEYVRRCNVLCLIVKGFLAFYRRLRVFQICRDTLQHTCANITDSNHWGQTWEGGIAGEEGLEVTSPNLIYRRTWWWEASVRSC